MTHTSPHQQEAELNAPSPASKATQHTRIIRELVLNGGFVTPMGCIHRVPCITTKLSTRIGEIEAKSGVKFTRERMEPSHFIKYSCTPEQLNILKNLFLNEGAATPAN